MQIDHFNIAGLTDSEINESRTKHGINRLQFKKEHALIDALKSLAKEPMVLLLLVASIIYFVTGNTGDAIFLASAIVLVSAISLYQDSRSRNALQKLKEFTQPNCTVIRNSKVVEIKSEDLVVGDSLMVEEGTTIAADGIIVHSNDFSVNESILTGESLPVFKSQSKKDNLIYNGTSVTSGLAIATITAIGNETQLGKIGKSIEDIKQEKTPLEKQIGHFVKIMVIIGAVVFIIVWVINYFRSNDVLDSLLKALTLAMSILPEEIPVAFTTFMALGAWRLMKMGIIVKQMKTVETLGSSTVICTDKTGTITQNKMSLAKLYLPESNRICNLKEDLTLEEKQLIRLSMWASEPIPFDPMEVALHETYSRIIQNDERSKYKMVHEYPLSGKPPMMTHIFKDHDDNFIIATKGAPEAIMKAANLTKKEKEKIEEGIKSLTLEGFRVLGVAETPFQDQNFPERQQDFNFQFKGLVAFYDPPKEKIQDVFEDFYSAGINVKIVTGDNAETTASIAKSIGFSGYESNISGEALMKLNDSELQKVVKNSKVFTRMFPDAKLKIINALKSQNEIVAMIGDGVNDGPALKSAHIGIAMGKKGTEIAKQAASLILLEDDLAKMVEAVAMGRKIYDNLKKAIQYIISIHIPIILTVFIPLALGWIFPNIFTPVHIIFLELIMGPTCSIIYENEPMEKNTMTQKPRLFTKTFFSWNELATSIIQGLMITAGTLITYQYAVNIGCDELTTRSMVFTALISSNIFLTLVNRSFYYSVFTTMQYKNNLVPIMISATIFITGLLLYIHPLARFFKFESLDLWQLIFSIGAGFIFVMWYELVKWWKRKKGIVLQIA